MARRQEGKALLAYEVTGKRGGAPKHTPDTGSVRITADESVTITADAYQGFGSDYRRRDKTLITVHSTQFGDVYRGSADGMAAIRRSAQRSPTQMVDIEPAVVEELPSSPVAEQVVGKSGEPAPQQDDDPAAVLGFGDVLE